MVKQRRHKAIKEIISDQQIGSQEILLNILQEKGFELTQATLSRDMKEMQVVKVPLNDGTYIYQMTKILPELRVNNSRLTSYGFLSLEFSGNLAVIKTRPGYAMGIAAEIDQHIKDEIIGTVAGDDTILLIIRENITNSMVRSALSQIISDVE
ncbi:MAG: arginine repressor [Dysgonomonas sp.]